MIFNKTVFITTIGLLIGLSSSINAQSYNTKSIKMFIEKKRSYNKDFGFGYRIQLYNGNETTAKKISAKFKTTFPDVKVFLKYIEPEWKIQVGNYKTRLEADKFLLEFQQKFNSAIVVPLG